MAGFALTTCLFPRSTVDSSEGFLSFIFFFFEGNIQGRIAAGKGGTDNFDEFSACNNPLFAVEWNHNFAACQNNWACVDSGENCRLQCFLQLKLIHNCRKISQKLRATAVNHAIDSALANAQGKRN